MSNIPAALHPYFKTLGEPVVAATYLNPRNNGSASGLVQLLSFITSAIGIKLVERPANRLLALGQSGRAYVLEVAADSDEVLRITPLDGLSQVRVQHDAAAYAYTVEANLAGQRWEEKVLAYPVGGDYSPQERQAFVPLAAQLISHLGRFA